MCGLWSCQPRLISSTVDGRYVAHELLFKDAGTGMLSSGELEATYLLSTANALFAFMAVEGARSGSGWLVAMLLVGKRRQTVPF